MTRISKEHAKKLGIDVSGIKEKSNKLNNKWAEIDGIKFQSRLEATYYELLKLRKKGGDIKDFELQPKFWLLSPEDDKVTGRGIKYIADFKIIHNNGEEEIIDTKGYKTQVYKLKKKWLLYKYPDINFKEITEKDI